MKFLRWLAALWQHLWFYGYIQCWGLTIITFVCLGLMLWAIWWSPYCWWGLGAYLFAAFLRTLTKESGYD